MHHSTETIVGFVAATVALFAAAAVWLPWFKGAINHRIFAEQIAKLAYAGNVDRARKLCAAAPDSQFVFATLRAVELRLHAGDVTSEGELAHRLDAAFREAIVAKVAATSRPWWMWAVALVALAVMGAEAAQGAWLALILGAVPVLMLLHTYALARGLAGDVVRYGHTITSALAASKLG